MLRDLQQAFVDAIIAGKGGAAAHISDGKLPSTRRIEIYRHNVFSNLRGVLSDVFPVVERIVGDAFFRHAADQFIRETPSRSGDLNQFGREWPAFLANYTHAQSLTYLPDVARLEWAWHECFHAADAPPLDLRRLAAIDSGQHGALIFRLHPAVRLQSSTFPLLRIWQVNQPDFAGAMDVDWAQGGDALLVRRDQPDMGGIGVVIQGLPAGAWQFLIALQGCATLEVATAAASAAALAADGEFDLHAFLLQSVQSGVITDFIHG